MIGAPALPPRGVPIDRCDLVVGDMNVGLIEFGLRPLPSIQFRFRGKRSSEPSQVRWRSSRRE